MKKQINKDIIPILIAVILMVISIGFKIFTDYSLNYKHYVGFGLICISSILYFKNKKLFVYVFVITLTLGIANLIEIFVVSMEAGIGPIKFNLTFLTLLVLFLSLNKEMLNRLFPKKELSESELIEKKAEKEKLIKNYELKFQSNTESELKNIADEKSGFVDAAKNAARNILRNKYVL